MMKKWMMMMFSAALLTAGCSNETDNGNEKKTIVKTEEALAGEKVEKDTAQVSYKNADLSNIKEAVPALAAEINARLSEIKLPSAQSGFNSNIGSMASLKDNVFNLFLRLEDRSTESEGKPLNVHVRTYSQEAYDQFLSTGYTKQAKGKYEFLLSPNGGKSIAFKDGGYLYQLDSISTNMMHAGAGFSPEELMAFAEKMNSSSEYMQFFKINLENYKIPSYFTDDKTTPYWLLAGYDYKGETFNPDYQYMQISNSTMKLEQSTLHTEFDPFGEEMTIDGNVGYLDWNSGFEMAVGDQAYSLKPAVAEVDQETGKVVFVEIADWESEATKLISSLDLPSQNEIKTTVKEDPKKNELSEKQDREHTLRIDLVKEVYTDATLHESVFDKVALGFDNLGPEVSVGYMRNELFKRYNQADKDVDNLDLVDSNKWSLTPNAVTAIEELFAFYEINENEVFYVKDELQGEPTFIWVLQMTNTVDGYRVINIYDHEADKFLTDF